MADSHGNSNATTSGGGFTSLPTLSYAQSQDSATKPEFLAQLRAALLDVGFLYLKDFGASNKLLQDVKDSCKAFFEELSDEEKLKVEMVHKPSFLGYSRVSQFRALMAAYDVRKHKGWRADARRSLVMKPRRTNKTGESR